MPPPFIAAGNIFLFYLSTFLIPSFEFTGQTILGVLIGLEGVIIIFVAIRLFRKNQTTINPFKAHETSRLITSGIYSFTRNPMYLGLSSIQVAFGVYLGSHVSIFLIPTLFASILSFELSIRFNKSSLGLPHRSFSASSILLISSLLPASFKDL